MRVLVCGGRDYDDAETVCAVLDRVHLEHPISCIMQGGANGADQLARSWSLAEKHAGHIERLTFSADWKRLGPKAGPIRNAKMLSDGKPDLVVAFPGGRGTADMVRRSKAAGVRVIEIPLPYREERL